MNYAQDFFSSLLAKLELETPSRLIEISDALYIPLYLPVGVERDKVVEALSTQVREIAKDLKAKVDE